MGHAGLTYIMVTLTLPSSGKVHFRDQNQPVSCHCRSVHSPDDPLLGVPLDPQKFDYDGLVRRNATIGSLWGRSMDAIAKALRKKSRSPHLSWFGAPEPHESGALHIHAVLAVNIGDEDLEPYRQGGRTRSRFIENLFSRSSVNATIGGKPTIFRWGSNVMAELTSNPLREVSIDYILKGTGSSPMTSTPTGLEDAKRAHLARMQAAAHRLIDLQLAAGEIKALTARRRHAKTVAGWTGNPLLKSQNWSTRGFDTRRKERAAHGRRNCSESATRGSGGTWRYLGRYARLPERRPVTSLPDSPQLKLPLQSPTALTPCAPASRQPWRRAVTPNWWWPWICIDGFRHGRPRIPVKLPHLSRTGHGKRRTFVSTKYG